jgi:hypothetical protein
MPRKPTTVCVARCAALGQRALAIERGAGSAGRTTGPLHDESQMLVTFGAGTHVQAVGKPVSFARETSNSKSVRALPLALDCNVASPGFTVNKNHSQ